jgi:hypothetical protein
MLLRVTIKGYRTSRNMVKQNNITTEEALVKLANAEHSMIMNYRARNGQYIFNANKDAAESLVNNGYASILV